MFRNEGKTIGTKLGVLPLASLRKIEERTGVPCGIAHTISYLLGDEIVRQDITIYADNALSIGGDIGRLV